MKYQDGYKVPDYNDALQPLGKTNNPTCPTCGGSGKARIAQPTKHQQLPNHGPDSDELGWVVSKDKYPCLDCHGTGQIAGVSEAYVNPMTTNMTPNDKELVNNMTTQEPKNDAKVELCKKCGTMKHVNEDGLCGRCEAKHMPDCTDEDKLDGHTDCYEAKAAPSAIEEAAKPPMIYRNVTTLEEAQDLLNLVKGKEPDTTPDSFEQELSVGLKRDPVQEAYDEFYAEENIPDTDEAKAAPEEAEGVLSLPEDEQRALFEEAARKSSERMGAMMDTTPDSFEQELRSIISLYETQVAEDLTAMEDENYRPKYSLNEPVAAILAAHTAELVRELQALANSNNWRVTLQDRLEQLQRGSDERKS